MEIPTEQAVDGPQDVSLQIYTDIRSHLIVGKLLPGDALSIRTLAAKRGIGTMPVREALKQLAMEKVLTGVAKKA